MKDFIVVILLLFSNLFVWSQVDLSEHYCVQTIKDDIQKNINFKSSNGAVYHSKIRVTNIDQKNAKESEEIINVYKSKNQLHYIAQSSAFYQDQKHAFLIIYPAKTIVKTSSTDLLKTDLEKKAALKLKIFDFADTFVYKSLAQNGTEWFLEVQLDEEGQDIFKIKKMSYFFSEKQTRITKVIAEYLPSYEYKMIQTEYLEVDFSYKRNMDQPIEAIFLTANNKLKDKYSTYRLIDKD